MAGVPGISSSDEHYNPTHAEHKTGRQFRWYNVFVVLVMSVGGSSIFGYTSSVIGMTLAQPTFIAYMELDTRPDAADLIGLTTSLYNVGGLVGLIFSSWTSDRYGRKIAIAILAGVTIVGGILTTASVSIGMFLAARFIVGIAGWSLLAIVPLWVNEIAAPSIRGVLMEINMAIMATAGYILSACLGYAFYHLADMNNWSWRAPLIFQLPWPILLLCVLWFLPESPRWLMMQDRTEKAEAVLQRLHQPQEAQVEAFQIRQAVVLQRSIPSSWTSMITKKSYRKRTILGIYVCLAGQLMGTFSITQYNPIIYGTLGFGTDSVLQYTIGYVTFSTGMIYVGTLIVDRLRRHVMMSAGLFAGSVSLAILAALVATYTTPEQLRDPNLPALRAAIAFVYLTSGCYQLLYEAVQFAYLGEIFPTQLRAKGLVLGVGVIALINIMWLQVGPIAFETIGWKFYLCFAIPTAICGVIHLLVIPDTLRMPLEEVNKLFGDYDGMEAEIEDIKAASAEGSTEKNGVTRHVEHMT